MVFSASGTNALNTLKNVYVSRQKARQDLMYTATHILDEAIINSILSMKHNLRSLTFENSKCKICYITKQESDRLHFWIHPYLEILAFFNSI